MRQINRALQQIINRDLAEEAGVVLLGPRQIGKTTLAQNIADQHDAVYLDLESPQGRNRLRDPEAFFQSQQGKLVVLDEVQTFPELFATLRGIIDSNRRAGVETGQVLLLGSASDKLLRQSSESLAGRVAYRELTGFSLLELDESDHQGVLDLWVRGGYPRSFLASNDGASFRIRQNLHRSVIERDIRQLAGNLNGVALDRFWRMLSGLQGQTFNASNMAVSIGATSPTASRYLDVFEDLMLVRRLRPWFKNSKKRMVKAPKAYIRDTGLLHYLLGIQTLYDLQGHHIYGHSWEGFVVEQIAQVLDGSWEMLHYRSSGGAEIDLVLEGTNQRWAIEIKASSTPKVRKGFFNACLDIEPTHRVVVHTGKDDFPYGHGVMAMSLKTLLKKLKPMNQL